MPKPADVVLSALSLRDATPQEFADLTVFENAMRLERQPEDPPIGPDELAAQARGLPPFVDVCLWLLRDGPRVVGSASLVLLRLEQNAHLAQFDLGVLPEHRRRGLGTRLLREVVAAAEADGRQLLMTHTSSRAPDGEAALAHAGAQAALANHTNQLDLGGLAPALLDRWLDHPDGAHEILLWDGPIPDGHLPGMADLMAVMNTAPRGDLEMEDFHFDVAQLRDLEHMRASSGRRRLMTVARHGASGALVGYSELSWHPDRAGIVSQGATGVRPEARGHGLGRRLKAANLRALGAANPDARFVRTSNADSNAAMLRINAELGFAPHQATTDWQWPVAAARAHLDQR